MKNNCKNKILGILCLLMLSFGLTGCSGCEKNTPPLDSEVTQESEEKEFSLNYHIYELELYESFQLKVKYYDELTWSSDQPTIVSVDADGKVTANGYGSATITVTCGTKTDSCIFTVLNEGNVPTIKTNTAKTGIALLNGDTFLLDCAIDFNGEEFTDASFSFSSSDNATVSVGQDGKITAKKMGEAIVTVKASWRNFDEVYLTKNILVKVNPDFSFELTPETNTLATVTERIDDNAYVDTCRIDYKAMINGVDKTSELEVEWLSSNTNIVTVEDGVVTAHSRGEAEITASVTVDNKTYTSLPVKIQVFAPVKYLTDNRFVYDVINEQSLQIDNLQGEVYSVSTPSMDYTEDCEVEEDSIRIPGKYLDTLRGNENFRIETPLYSYVFETVFATHTISNGTELKALMDSYYGNNGSNATDKESTEGWYVVVTQDFSYNNSVGHGSASSRFRGVFDGMGHTISNVTVKANGGMFGGLEGTIKNLAVEGLTAEDANCFLLAGYLYNGTVENVFVRGSFLTASNCGFVRLGGGSVSNCIVDITYPKGGEGAAYGAKETDQTTPENATIIANSYAIGNAVKFRPYDEETTVYATTEAFLSACGDKITSDNGFNEFWSGDEYGIYFGKTPVITLTAVEKEQLIKTSDFTLDTSALLGGAAEYALIDNERVEISQNGILQFKIDDFTKGVTHVVSIRGNGKIVNQPFVIPTHVIDTAEEMIAFWDSYNKSSVQTAGWYVVLTKDIDLNGVTRSQTNHQTYNATTNAFGGMWQGHFNGLGHVVANFKTNGQGGFFGPFANGAIVENVAFVGVEHCGNDGFVFTNYARGTMSYIRNVYIEGVSTSTRTDEVCVIRGGALTVQNVIVNFARVTDGKSYALRSDMGASNGSNLYVIGGLTNVCSTEDRLFGTQLYATVADWSAANATNITAANGWNMDCWHFSGSDLYFGVKKVEDITYTSVSADTIILPN